MYHWELQMKFNVSIIIWDILREVTLGYARVSLACALSWDETSLYQQHNWRPHNGRVSTCAPARPVIDVLLEGIDSIDSVFLGKH